MYKFLLLGIQLALGRCYLQIFQDMAFGGSAQKVSFRELIDSVQGWTLNFESTRHSGE